MQTLGGEFKWPFHSSRKELLEVQCDGDERSVLDCSVDTTRRNCLHEIAVYCYGKLLGYAIKGLKHILSLGSNNFFSKIPICN